MKQAIVLPRGQKRLTRKQARELFPNHRPMVKGKTGTWEMVDRIGLDPLSQSLIDAHFSLVEQEL